jgi:glycosyltransferase involved in cell wall biosynthesis
MARIVVNCIQFGEKAGGARHLRNLIEQLVEKGSLKSYCFLVNQNMKGYVEAAADSVAIYYPGKLVDHPISAIFYRVFCLPFWIKFNGHLLFVDLFNPMVLFSFVKTVVVIRDLAEFRIANKYDNLRMFYRKKIMLPLTIRRADQIVAISQATRNDIEDLFPGFTGKINVVHHGRDLGFYPKKTDSRLLRRLNIRGAGYLLTVGRVDAIGKNLLNLIKAYELLLEEYPDAPDLVLAGAEWRLKSDLNVPQSVMGKLIFPGYIDEPDLASVYSMASALVFPSIYEGFGHPILEGMSCEIPVICSNVSSLPEIGGDAVITFDPYDPKDICCKLVQVLTDEHLRAELVSKGKQRVTVFDWSKNVAAYEEIFSTTRPGVLS